jgi:hypothetical protein
MNGPDLAAALGIEARQLYRWNHTGYLHPEVIDTPNGRCLRYGAGDVETAIRLVRLVNAGMPAPLAFRLVNGDTALATALTAELDTGSREPVLEPMLRDEPAAERALLDAMDISMAVRDVDPRDLWADLEALQTAQHHRLLAAVVALAALVPIDSPVSELLAWTEPLSERGAA